MIVAFLSINCMGQNKPIIMNLQQIEFKDAMLTESLVALIDSKPECFRKNEFYTLDFFQSSLYNDEYYLSIDVIEAASDIADSIAYYSVINGITFFVAGKVASDIYRVLPVGKEFIFRQEEIPYYVGGDYWFLIWKTVSGHYHVLWKTCSE